MIATADIFQLSPDFHNAVVSLHNTTMPIAFVVCAAGLLMAAVRAQYERSLSSIWPELVRIFLVSMFLLNNRSAAARVRTQCPVEAEKVGL